MATSRGLFDFFVVLILWLAFLVLAYQSFYLPMTGVKTTMREKAFPPLLHLKTMATTTTAMAMTMTTTSTSEEWWTTSDKETTMRTTTTTTSPLFLSLWFNDDNSLNNDQQMLHFVEPKTNITVILIGAMHYNPALIQLVKQSLENLGNLNWLGSIIIKSCNIRWNKMQEIMDKKLANRKTMCLHIVLEEMLIFL